MLTSCLACRKVSDVKAVCNIVCEQAGADVQVVVAGGKDGSPTSGQCWVRVPCSSSNARREGQLMLRKPSRLHASMSCGISTARASTDVAYLAQKHTGAH